MAKKKTQEPPVTEILSETREELGTVDPTSPKQELAVEEEPEPEVKPEDQPFVEGAVEKEIVHDPLKDTQAKLTQTAQELAEQKKMLQAVIANQEMGGAGPGSVATSPAQPPPEFFDPKPTADEIQDPHYPMQHTLRLMKIDAYVREQGEIQREMQQFVRDNPDWADSLSEMRRIKQENPYAYVGLGAVPHLHERAQEKKKLATMETKLQEVQEQALQAGVKLGKQSKNKPFVTPGGVGGGGMPQSGAKMPADFSTWSTANQKKWLIQHGLWKPDTY